MKILKRYRTYIVTVILMGIIVLGGVVSGAVAPVVYRDKADCFHCGDVDGNILNAYDQNDIGIIRFNEWGLSPFYLLPEAMSGTNRISSNGRGGSAVSVSNGYNRRLASASISLGENSSPVLEHMSTFLCEDCAKAIQAENRYDVALIDLQTRDIIPLEEGSKLFFIHDYVIHTDWNLERDNIEIMAFYAPKLPEKDDTEELKALEKLIEEAENKK